MYYSVNYAVTIVVPCASGEAYHNAPYWSAFDNIEERFLWTLKATSEDDLHGSVSILTEPSCAIDAVITATPNEGYHFVRWSDGATDNPYSFKVTSDTMIIALFVADEYTVTAEVNDDVMGSVTGSGTYLYGDTATLTAISNEGYHFAGWSDGATDNPYSFRVTSDTTITAIFEADESGDTEGIGTVADSEVSIKVAGRQIAIAGAEGRPVTLYDIQGRRIAVYQPSHAAELRITVPATGIYMLRIGSRPAQRIAVLR